MEAIRLGPYVECKTPGCFREVSARGLCSACYKRELRKQKKERERRYVEAAQRRRAEEAA